MTHEELRDFIDKFDAAGMVNEPAVKALRAVVELHKPEPYSDMYRCVACVTHNKLVTVSKSYPCQTIQAIEKALV